MKEQILKKILQNKTRRPNYNAKIIYVVFSKITDFQDKEIFLENFAQHLTND